VDAGTFGKDEPVIKRLRFQNPLRTFLMLAIGLGLFNGCAITASKPLQEEVPSSPSSFYTPAPPLIRPAQLSTGGEEIPSFDGRTLSLAQCMEIALERNPETRVSWQRIKTAAAGVGQARSGYLPSADFTAGANRGDPVSLDNSQQTGAASTFAAGFGVRYLLFDGGLRSAGLKGAEAELLNANFQHNATLQDVALNVEEAYYQLLAARELEQVAQQTVRQTQYHLDIARMRHQNGIVARSDVLRAETEQADANLQLVRARSQVRITRGQLANRMGLQPSASFALAELPRNPHQQELADIKKLMLEATAQRPELRAALARIEFNEAQVKAAKTSYWPKITLNTDYGWQGRTFVPDRKEWSLGISIALPLFDGFNREHAIRRTKSDLAKITAEYNQLLQGVELEVWTAYVQLNEAGETIEAARTFVASAEENARVTEGEYANGTASIIEVTDAQTGRTSARVHLVQARLDWYTALARLERAIGRTFVRGKPTSSKE